MDSNTTVVAAPAANPAPAAPVPASPAPAAPAAPQEDAAEEGIVYLADIMKGEPKAAALGSGQPKPEDKNATLAPDSPKPEPAKAEPAPYKSQKEVDAAFGKRIDAERKKWERNHPSNKVMEVLRDMNPGLSDEQLLAKLEGDRDTALEINPQLSAMLKRRGLLSNPAQEPTAEGGEPADAPMSDEDADSASASIGAEADEIVKNDPTFDMTKFLNENKQYLPAIARGEMSLTDLYFRKEGKAAVERIKQAAFDNGKADTVKNIRERNDRVPAPVSPSTPPGVARDFSTMSKEEFDKHQQTIKAALARGEKVRL